VGTALKESMRKLMHNVELLVVTTGKGNWRGASESIAKAKMLLAEIERDVQSRMRTESEERRKREQRTVRVTNRA
jgi:hypothetical protein